MAVAQAGGAVAVIKLLTNPAGSLASCDFSSLGRIGLSFETAVTNGGALTSVEM